MAQETLTGLSLLQKDALILLLASLIVIGLTLLIAWIVWKKWCGAELKRARAAREEGFEEGRLVQGSGSFTERSNLFRRNSATSSNRTDAFRNNDPDFWEEPSGRPVEPTAPAMETFRRQSPEAPFASMETMSSEFGGRSSTMEPSESRLPSYESIMRNQSPP